MATGRILVVDDEPFFQELFREVLSAAGHATRTAASAEEALSLFDREHFDLILTDIVMPGLDGIGLVQALKKRDPDIEAVAVTGHEDVRLAVQAMKAGCAEFLTKPVDRAELGEVAERVLQRVRLKREHSQLLSENMEFARSQAIYRLGLQILSTLDGEKLQDLVLSILARVTDAQGAALWLLDERGQLLLRSYRGLVDRGSLPPMIDPRDRSWSGPLSAGIHLDPFGGSGGSFLVPLRAEEELLGAAFLSDRARGRFGPDDQAAAVTVADFSAIAVKNARRFQALERIGLRDRDTGAYNLAYFVDYAGKEFYKARRYGRSFSLMVLSLDNAEAVRREAGREPYRRMVREVVAAVARVSRDADILAKVSESEYYVLLPETDYFGALMFQRRAAEEIRRAPSIRELDERAPVLLSMGAATFPKDGEDFDELLHWAKDRIGEQRGSLLRRLHLEDLERSAFWELADVLLSKVPLPETSPSARLEKDPEFLLSAQREAAREVARDPRARGHLYVGVSGPIGLAAIREALPGGEQAARVSDQTMHVYLLGPRGAGPDGRHHPLLTEVYLDGDKRLAEHEFLLFISEHSAYGLITGPGGRMFHTSDVPLVDALVAKLQALYDLQPL